MTCPAHHRKQLGSELAAIQQLDGQRGRGFWRSLEELSGDSTFQNLMMREFPSQASVWPDALSRRNFLSLMGASLALGGLGGCSVRPRLRPKLFPT